MSATEIGRVVDVYSDDEGYLRVDVATRRDFIKNLRVCGRAPVIGENVMVIDRSYALVPIKLPHGTIEPVGAEFIGSTPEGSFVECNPYGVIISSGELTSILATMLDDLVKIVSRRLEIHNDAFSLETFYKEPGHSVLRLAGSTDTELNRSEVYDWYFVVEDDTIKIEKWNQNADSNLRAYVHVKKDEIRIGVENKLNKKRAELRITPSLAQLEVVDESRNWSTKVNLSAGAFNLLVNTSNGSSKLQASGGNVLIESSENITLKSTRIDLNP